MTGDTAYRRLLDSLTEHGATVRDKGSSSMATCPAHSDRAPSLSIRAIEGQVLMHCHAGCDTADVLAALGLSLGDLFDDARGAAYRYDDGRTVTRTPDKRFRQSGHAPGVVQLYRLGRVSAAVRGGVPVYLVEGEKDVHAIESLGAVATTAPMGAANFAKVDTAPLVGAHLIVVPDQDASGAGWLRDVLALCLGLAASIEVRSPKSGKDAADHIAAGYGLGDLALMDEHGCVPARRVRFTRVSEIPMRRVRWAWDTAPPDTHPRNAEGRLPCGSLVTAAGRAGIGKSQMACWFAARITRGTLPGEWWGQPQGVAYAASEDSWAMTIKPRLVAAGADTTMVHRVDVLDDGDRACPLSLPRDLADLERLIAEESVVLVVLDPLLSVLDSRVDDYRAREVRAALEPLGAMADRTGALLFGIAHFIKGAGSDPLHMVSGSAAFGQVVRAALGFAECSDDDGAPTGAFAMSTIKNNLGRMNLASLEYRLEPVPVEIEDRQEWVSRVTFTGEEAPSVWDLLRRNNGNHGEEESRAERDEAAEWLRGYLMDGGRGGRASANDVFKAGRMAGGWSPDMLKRAKKRARVRSVKSGGTGAPWVWSVEPEITQESKEGEGSTFSRTCSLNSLTPPSDEEGGW